MVSQYRLHRSRVIIWLVSPGATLFLVSGYNLTDFSINIGNHDGGLTGNPLCYNYPGSLHEDATVTLGCGRQRTGRYLSIQQTPGTGGSLALCEVQVYGLRRKFIKGNLI